LKKASKIFLIYFSFLSLTLFSQQIRVDAVLDTAKMRIGEQVNVDLYLRYDANMGDVKIQWPSIADTLTDKIEVISVSPIDTTFPNKTNSTQIFQHQRVTISVYDSGFYAVPPFKFFVNNNKDSIYTNMLFLEVHTVPTDTSAKSIRDIKPPFEEKFNWKWYIEYVYWAIGVYLAILVAVLTYLHFNKKERHLTDEPLKPKVPPHVTALAELEKIKQEQIWRDGRVKEYYSMVSDTVRFYIEGRFGINAPESTTHEIMTMFRSQVIDASSKEKLQQLLTLSDLVKFAKMTPLEPEHELTLKSAFDFVLGTLREEIVEPTVEPGENTTAS